MLLNGAAQIEETATRSAVGRPVWMEENIFALSSSNFSIPWYLFYYSELSLSSGFRGC
jgi:hypothetical protein